MNAIYPIPRDKECVGKWRDKKDAVAFAASETQRTGRRHHAFLTHYNDPYTFDDFVVWTVILTQDRRAKP